MSRDLKVDIEFRFRSGFEVTAKLIAVAGECVSLTGPSGSGKSTVLSLIAGLRRPTTGTIDLGHRKFYSSAASIDLKPWERRVGLLFQNNTLFPHMSVEKNLRYGMRNLNDSPWQLDSLVQRFEIGNLLTRRPSQLSGGQKDRVALTRTLLSQPEALLLDEPLNSVEKPLRASILNFVRSSAIELGIPSIWVSHDSHVQALDHAAVYKIDDGELRRCEKQETHRS